MQCSSIVARVITPRELASLQSFQDDFIFEVAKKWQLVQIENPVYKKIKSKNRIKIRKDKEINITAKVKQKQIINKKEIKRGTRTGNFTGITI